MEHEVSADTKLCELPNRWYSNMRLVFSMPLMLPACMAGTAGQMFLPDSVELEGIFALKSSARTI